MGDERKPHHGAQQRLCPGEERLIDGAELREDQGSRVKHLGPPSRRSGRKRVRKPHPSHKPASDFRATTRQDWRPAYLEAASGSIPLLLIASAARGEARNSINRLEAALSFDSATTAAAKTWINWIADGRVPA